MKKVYSFKAAISGSSLGQRTLKGWMWKLEANSEAYNFWGDGSDNNFHIPCMVQFTVLIL